MSELYTLSTGSSTRLVGLTHSGMAEEDALGASAGADMLKGLRGMRDWAEARGVQESVVRKCKGDEKERESDDSNLV